MLQNIITDVICVNCNANLMADLAEDGALFDTAMGNGGTTGNLRSGFECGGVSLGGWLWLAGAPHIAKTTPRTRGGDPAGNYPDATEGSNSPYARG